MEQQYYIDLQTAVAALRERRSMRQKVETWWKEKGWKIPSACLSLENALVFGKPIATRRYEDALFVHLAESLDLQPVWMEYTQGSLSTESPYKRSLIHPTFYEKRGRTGGIVVRKHRLACMQSHRMQPIHEIRLAHTETVSLVDYHHTLLDAFGFGPQSRVDLSGFYRQFGRAVNYYAPYLSLFLAHGVLVEDYHGGEDAAVVGDFTSTTFEPAMQELYYQFGVMPLIARMPWHTHLAYFIPLSRRDDWRSHGVVPENVLSALNVR